MSRITWDKIGEHFYETGVEKGVLYPASNGAYPKGVAWNGLRSVTNKPTGAEATPLYANNRKYLNLISDEDFEGTIGCYTYPDEFDACIGNQEMVPGVKVSQQPRSQFGFSYVTNIGNDTDGATHAYKIHLVYGATASVSETNYETINNDPSAIELSYDFTTIPVDIPGMKKPAAHIEIDSRTVDPDELKALEDVLYGKDGEPSSEPRLPLPSELTTIFTKGI